MVSRVRGQVSPGHCDFKICPGLFFPALSHTMSRTWRKAQSLSQFAANNKDARLGPCHSYYPENQGCVHSTSRQVHIPELAAITASGKIPILLLGSHASLLYRIFPPSPLLECPIVTASRIFIIASKYSFPITPSRIAHNHRF